MSPSMNVHLMEALNATSVQLNRYFSLFIFIFGFTGNILNILVLTQRSIRSNPCVFLFLMSSIANLISIISGLTPRILSSWQIDFTETNDIFCKLRAFITFTSRTVALSLIMLATYERWIMSSSNLQHRQLSSIKNDRKGSLIVTLISIVIYLQMLYRYKANLMDAPLKCYGKTSACHLLTDIIYSCLTILFPLISMTVLGVLTLSNIRKTRTCMEPRKIRREERLNEKCLIIQQRQRQRWKKIDRYLRRMLLLQVISLILLTFPQAIHKVYFTMLSNKNKSQLQYDFDRFLYNFELLLLFIESALPFYIYTLAGGKVFRNALEKLLF
ncbi:unnamed protein product [Rotaria magnacalcarata]|uniref:G-protein coupled receptors family 1 profile domain-containing protein n=1 Tax=Rotaria magnacalcarata TaxID=392030 RepID=A0A820KP76_9BILA|nr:unnamed protein product [Rotaria magnacalcarata]CAF2202873.1 unnamed protein product [Rotaria magnacalcarata]CAF4345137.1 unnamed protein product [Rotaria magnacalcarata]CAF4605806.1 unnamed protein product [Rotaria magnacalcarata]